MNARNFFTIEFNFLSRFFFIENIQRLWIIVEYISQVFDRSKPLWLGLRLDDTIGWIFSRSAELNKYERIISCDSLSPRIGPHRSSLDAPKFAPELNIYPDVAMSLNINKRGKMWRCCDVLFPVSQKTYLSEFNFVFNYVSLLFGSVFCHWQRVYFHSEWAETR